MCVCVSLYLDTVLICCHLLGRYKAIKQLGLKWSLFCEILNVQTFVRSPGGKKITCYSFINNLVLQITLIS